MKISIINKKNGDIVSSRKWTLALLVLWIATVLVLFPPLISLILGKAVLVVISGEIWLGVVAIICGAYNVANVWQKKIESADAATDNLLNKLPDAQPKETPAPEPEEQK